FGAQIRSRLRDSPRTAANAPACVRALRPARPTRGLRRRREPEPSLAHRASVQARRGHIFHFVDCPIPRSAYNGKQEDRPSSEKSATMPSEHEKCANLAHDEAAGGCRLGTLCKRSQLDFEIEFFERILSRDPNYVEVLMILGELFTQKGCHRRALQVD